MSSLPLRSSYATIVAPRPATPTLNWRQAFARAVDQLLVWHERARQRRQLQSLSDHMLRDLGLGRADVETEAAKPFWRL